MYWFNNTYLSAQKFSFSSGMESEIFYYCKGNFYYLNHDFLQTRKPLKFEVITKCIYNIIFLKAGEMEYSKNPFFKIYKLPRWEGSLGENGYIHRKGWVPSLFTWGYHNIIVNQLHFNTKYKVQKKRKKKIKNLQMKWCLLVATETNPVTYSISDF